MRETFKTSRAMEYFSEAELTTQMGLSRDLWGKAILKELIDNALDICESLKKPPEIEIELTSDSFSVRDNGSGLPETTLIDSLDYEIRVSDKQCYVSPSRGQQGNALKTIWAAPFVANGKKGIIEVLTESYGSRIEVTLDAIANRPVIERYKIDPLDTPGTLIRVISPELRGLLRGEIVRLIEDFSVFNPHATFTLKSGNKIRSFPAIAPFKKWTPADPSSIYWYNLESFKGLISAYIANDRESGKLTTIREFITQFDGLKRTEKQKLIGSGMAPAKRLEDLATANGLDTELVGKLMELLKSHSEPVKPERLGVIGRESLETCFQAAIASGIDKYKKLSGYCDDGLPWVVEIGLARLYEEYERQLFWGVNFTPLIGSIPYSLSRLFGSENILIEDSDPIALMIHLAIPKIPFNDRGKSQVNIPREVLAAIQSGLEFVAKDWAKVKRKKKREDRVTWREINGDRPIKDKRVTVKDAAYSVMERAYLAVSDNRRLPANARQLMYYCRPLIIELTGKTRPWSSDNYFTQELLPTFIRDNPELTANWDVVYDSRGQFSEPHTSQLIQLGTLKVRHYLKTWRSPNLNFDHDSNFIIPSTIVTNGPKHRFNYALFIEKEGFLPLLESANIANRFDIAIFSTKGMSNTAARQLVEHLARENVTILIAHDFDKSGMTIARTLANDTSRYQFQIKPEVIDIGLRLEDVYDWGLGSEPVDYGKSDPRPELRACGCSEDEINFLARSHYGETFKGDRVELNALTSPQFIEWLENKFSEHGVTKVIPSESDLEAVYHLQCQRVHLENFYRENLTPLIEAEVNRLKALETSPPDGLTEAIANELEKDPAIPWDLALWRIVQKSVTPPDHLAS